MSHVLLVEADGRLRALIEAELEEAGHEVTAFTSIGEALTAAHWAPRPGGGGRSGPGAGGAGPAGCAVPGDAGAPVRRGLRPGKGDGGGIAGRRPAAPAV